MYRPWFDHSVYDYDNHHLPSTWESRAQVHHLPTWQKPMPGADEVPNHAVEVLPWGGLRQRRCLSPPAPAAPLRVFHYGGHCPYAKGTHDVLAVAAQLPDVHFEISAEPEHPLLRHCPLDNGR